MSNNLSNTLGKPVTLGTNSPNDALQPDSDKPQLQAMSSIKSIAKSLFGTTTVLGSIVAKNVKENKQKAQQAQQAKQATQDFEDSFSSPNPPTVAADPGFYGPTSAGDETTSKTGPKHLEQVPVGKLFHDLHQLPLGIDGGLDSPGSDSGMDGLGSDSGGGGGFGFGLPVLLDLNGDGIEIITLGQSRAHFDIDGDGRRQIMAWVGPDDALLVYDRDGDRLISHKDEIAFADYLANAETDLEGLAWFDMAAQGGNEDGMLNALDALWSKFGVWQDIDQDGETDPGELTMTGEGGLSSVNLQSDHIPRDAGPDAQIYGKGEYQTTDADGRMRSGDLYDASLRYEPTTEPLSAAEIFYPSQPVKLTPEQQGYRRVRKDGQPLSKAEIFYPDESRAHEYTYVRNEPDEAVIQQQKNADLLYDHPTSNPKK